MINNNMELKFNNVWDVDNYTFKKEENNTFIYKLISCFLEKEIEYNPEQYVSQLHPSSQQIIVDFGNIIYNRELDNQS
jgi:hypothetical protein